MDNVRFLPRNENHTTRALRSTGASPALLILTLLARALCGPLHCHIEVLNILPEPLLDLLPVSLLFPFSKSSSLYESVASQEESKVKALLKWMRLAMDIFYPAAF